MPEWKKEAIYRLRPVYYTKIFLKFPSKFWGDSEWILHVSAQNTRHFPVFFDLDRAGFFPGSKSLYTVVTGDESLRVEAQDDSKTMEELMEALRNMYGPSLPNATGTNVTDSLVEHAVLSFSHFIGQISIHICIVTMIYLWSLVWFIFSIPLFKRSIG